MRGILKDLIDSLLPNSEGPPALPARGVTSWRRLTGRSSDVLIRLEDCESHYSGRLAVFASAGRSNILGICWSDDSSLREEEEERLRNENFPNLAVSLDGSFLTMVDWNCSIELCVKGFATSLSWLNCIRAASILRATSTSFIVFVTIIADDNIFDS